MSTVVLDANNLAARSYHAARGRLSSHGVETGSLHLFMRSLAMHLAQLQPDRFVAVWDGGRSVYREKLYPQYKAARRHTGGETVMHRAYGLIEDFLDIVGVAQWRREGFEADDLVAAAVRTTEGPMTILSADKDLLQLLTRDEIDQIRFSSGAVDTDRWTRSLVLDRMGCLPEQLPYLMALTGDASDGVPGARGIGPKKALKLLQTVDWDFDQAVAGLPDADLVRTCLRLVDLHEVDVDVPEVPQYRPISLRSPEQQWAALRDFCVQYEFRTLWDDLANGTLLARGSPG